MLNRLNEDTLMPCTMHVGKRIGDVPPQFLLWLDKNAKPLFRRKYYLIMLYIEENKAEILKKLGEIKENLVDS